MCTVLYSSINVSKSERRPTRFYFHSIRKLKEIEIYRDGMRSSGKFFIIKKTVEVKEEDMINSERHHLVFKF